MATTLDRLMVIDVDTHLSEPWDLWTSGPQGVTRTGCPRSSRSRAATAGSSTTSRSGGRARVSVIAKDMEKQYDMSYLFNTPVHEVAGGGSQVKPRLAMMDEQGMWAHLIYPNVVGFGGQQFGGVPTSSCAT